MKYILLLFIGISISCKTTKKELTAQEIIDNAMKVAGSEIVSKATISFDFRDKSYEAIRKNGSFQLKRSFDSITDVLNNQSFQRFIEEKSTALSDSLANVYSNSVNSVHYFSVLPFGLNDVAVRKKLLPSSTVFKKEYYKIEITFSENGGGTDFEDVFIYWFGKEDFKLDYLAYSFHVNGGGKRFRAIKNEQTLNGIRFVNYDNFKSDNNLILSELDKAFENNQLEKISEIVLENVKVNSF